LDNDSTILFFDSHLSNKSIISKISTSKKINLKHVKISDADPKNNEINISDVAAQIRRVHKVIISAESILKNGAVIANSGSLMVALAAKKYNIPVIIVARGFSLT
jgi:fructose-1-phosphate kinase PfkB-like protein